MIAKHFATSYQSGQESGIGYQAKQSGNMPVAQEQPLIRSRADLPAAVAEGLSVMEWNSTGKAAMELGELLLPAKGRKELPTQRTAFYSEE